MYHPEVVGKSIQSRTRLSRADLILGFGVLFWGLVFLSRATDGSLRFILLVLWIAAAGVALGVYGF